VFANLTGWHALIIIAVVLLLFGATKLPALARSVGQSVKILQKEVQGENRDEDRAADTAPEASPGSGPRAERSQGRKG
jgi:sec-independent protein translocase protein TatA